MFRKSITFSIVLVFLLVVASSAADPSAAKLDPTLRFLVDQNAQMVEETGERLNIAPYAKSLGVYSDDRPVRLQKQKVITKDGTTDYIYEVPEGSSGYRVGLLIKSSSLAAVKGTGVDVGSVAGDVITAVGTLEQVEELSQLASVDYVEASRRVEFHLNESVPLIGAAKLHRQDPRLTGEGVIVGDVDTGIDYDHRDFRGGVNDQESRILYIWDQTENHGPTPAVFRYGTEYKKSDIEYDIAEDFGPDAGRVGEKDTGGHGTHVTGIMASDGSSNPDPSKYPYYVGMAPEAEIIMVKANLSTPTESTAKYVVDGVNYIFRKADRLAKPVVVNLSLGMHNGPHDGTSLFSRALEQLDGPGRLIVVSAGNEGADTIHAGTSLLPGDNAQVIFQVGHDGESGTSRGIAAINTWYSSDSQFSVKVASPGGDVLLTAPHGAQTSSATDDGCIFVDNASAGQNPLNGDNELEIQVFGTGFQGCPVDMKKGLWGFQITAPEGTSGGRFDSWYYWNSDGGKFEGPDSDSRMTIGIPGVAEDLITVGAEMTRTSWVNVNGVKKSYGDLYASFFSPSNKGNIAYFSSRGPTRDGRTKPELTAPGMAVVSALAGAHVPVLKSEGDYKDWVVEDGLHLAMQGTSMSAPIVSGQVALMLQEDPNLTPAQAKQKLLGTVKVDQYTSVGFDPAVLHNGGNPSNPFSRNVGPVSNNTWGHGKMDSARAARTLGLVLSDATKIEAKFGPNPAAAAEEVYLYYDLPDGSSDAKLKVYSAAGKEVYSASLSPAGDVYSWSLENSEGTPLANGIYLYVVTTGNEVSDIGKLIVQRR
ncbi:S8 family serine peptidase [Candidatus Bipolaricaulota bacterium]|nr:S8 family serine peptidase [Candidatus Bipolaricaulota bacterium]